jgi:hypothetical protein
MEGRRIKEEEGDDGRCGARSSGSPSSPSPRAPLGSPTARCSDVSGWISSVVTRRHGGRRPTVCTPEQGALSLHLRARVLQYGSHGCSCSRYWSLHARNLRYPGESQATAGSAVSERASAGRPVGPSPGSGSCSGRRGGQLAVGDQRAATAPGRADDSHAGSEPGDAAQGIQSPLGAQKIYRLPGRAQQHVRLPRGRRRRILPPEVIQLHVQR